MNKHQSMIYGNTHFGEKRVLFLTGEIPGGYESTEKTSSSEMDALFWDLIEYKNTPYDNPKKTHIVQTILRGLGYNPGKTDGDYGPKTRSAVVSLQKELHQKFPDQNILVDGIFGPQTAVFAKKLLSLRQQESPEQRKAELHQRVDEGFLSLPNRQQSPPPRTETTPPDSPSTTKQTVPETAPANLKAQIRSLTAKNLNNKNVLTQNAAAIQQALAGLGCRVSVAEIRQIPSQSTLQRPLKIKDLQITYGLSPDGWPGNSFWRKVAQDRGVSAAVRPTKKPKYSQIGDPTIMPTKEPEKAPKRRIQEVGTDVPQRPQQRMRPGSPYFLPKKIIDSIDQDEDLQIKLGNIAAEIVKNDFLFIRSDGKQTFFVNATNKRKFILTNDGQLFVDTSLGYEKVDYKDPRMIFAQVKRTRPDEPLPLFVRNGNSLDLRPIKQDPRERLNKRAERRWKRGLVKRTKRRMSSYEQLMDGIG